MRKLNLIQTIVCAASLLALAACARVSPAVSIPTATAPAPALPTEVPSLAHLPTGEVITALPSTVIPAPGGVPTAVTPAPSSGPDEGTVITLQDQGKTIRLKVGQSFLLRLGADIYGWTVNIENQAVVSRVMGVMVIRGAQGLYQARAPGTTTLTASGDPLCRQSQPACGMPSILFQVSLVVE